jgi:hypothetical protein
VTRCKNCSIPEGQGHEIWCREAPDGFDLGKLEEETRRLTMLEGIGMDKPVVVNVGGDYQRVTGMRVEFYRGQYVVVLDAVVR